MIPQEVLERRWRLVQTALEEAGLDALIAASRGVIGAFGNVFYLCGYAPLLRPAYAVLRRDGPPVLFASSETDVALLRAAGAPFEVRSSGATDARPGPLSTAEAVVSELRGVGRVGVAGLMDIVPAADADLFRRELGAVDASQLLARVKACKDAWELDRVRDAFALAGLAYDAGVALLAPGARAQELVAEVERVLRANGALEALVFVDSAVAFARRVTPTVLQRGDLVTVLVEVATEAGCWVEQGGLFSLGEPTARALAVADACYGALAEIRSAVAPGVPVARASEIAAEFAAAGGLRLGINLGHGIGTDHDLPRLAPGAPGVFAEGHVLSVHPNLFAAEAGVGGTVADALQVTATGCESLSGLPYELTTVAD